MKVIFTCGGTAGHVNPALALAGYMQKQDPHVQVLFVGTPDGMERDLVEKAGYAFRGIPMGGFQRSLGHGGLAHNLRSLSMLTKSHSRARAILRELESQSDRPRRESAPQEQMTLGNAREEEVLDALRRSHPDALTPLEAMQLLYELKKKLE